MPIYQVELPVRAWVTVEVVATSEGEAHAEALKMASPDSLTYDSFKGTALIEKISE